jgi:XTP/dITP diphosphohydrolase
MDKKLAQFERLLNIMDDLRAECPWDKKQTLESLRHLTIEETYELCDAILENDMDELKGEIGDLMLHLVFYSKIASEQKAFDIADVLEFVCEKLIRRHPHIYGDTKAETEEAVKANWEKIKLQEKGKGGSEKTVLQGVPKSLPALVKAVRIQDKVKGIGFDWDNKKQAWDKVQEEIKEFQVEEKNQDLEKMEQEFGDVLFSLVKYAGFVGINPEDALERTNKKFLKRFTEMELTIRKDGKDMKNMSLTEMESFWEVAKLNQLNKD